ncbi:MAG: 6,7-dimethyl-8-ribityllumazine synthase [Rhodospirillales bacterium RIFCSPLOWO2_12_FULL_58_28]|nr:MAG: 6,7-dimethyl-8-ribityllumazine synthase [Rhodospirillales bacterium RIFCSPLOWO2_02_FULL_58_16]OHC79042.1 MAG: 6,7-dimethyl-8-ribityllumazine synthase [Rhodospirillales bacterium RIFCSPLOWO2_12_FULL_58_28]
MSEKPRVLIIEARFYEDIADELAKGAAAVLDEAGIAYERHAVPGVFETPAAVHFAIRSMEMGAVKYSGVIVLGCVIRGETDHYEYISSSAVQALMNLTVSYSIALGFGVLTCENYEQARERAAVDRKNIGARAAMTCLRMMDLKKDFHLVIR